MSGRYKNEYTAPTVMSNGGCYTNLSCYNGLNATMPPLRAGTTSGLFVTPDYTAIGYDTLTHGESGGGCQQYFNINDAYGSGSNSCATSYTTRLCSSGCGGGSGKKLDWYCAGKPGGKPSCVPHHSGSRVPDGALGKPFPTSYQCQASCGNGAR